MSTKTITVTLTVREAHTVLRALATANNSDDTEKTDRNPNTWVALRIAAALGLTIDQFVKLVRR